MKSHVKDVLTSLSRDNSHSGAVIVDNAVLGQIILFCIAHPSDISDLVDAPGFALNLKQLQERRLTLNIDCETDHEMILALCRGPEWQRIRSVLRSVKVFTFARHRLQSSETLSSQEVERVSMKY
jgi:hypothetical protein